MTLNPDATVTASLRQQRYNATDLGTPNNAHDAHSMASAISPGGAFVAGIWQDGQSGS